MRYRAPRGTHDSLPADQALRQHILTAARRIAERAGYRPIEPPTFEQADLFIRGVGAGTDIVEKEMYLFDDRGGDRLALRPEGTASVCRAYLEHGLDKDPQPSKFYYHLPIFRYERPQAARYRQHTQFGIEALGLRDPALDAEIMEIGWRITEALGLRNLTLLLNSIGDLEDRQRYVPLLRAHFAPHLAALSPDDQRRFERAPLRLLDSKEESARSLQATAPLITKHLRPESRAFYEEVKRHLTALGIPYEERPTLVRGLDYYSHTVFEIVPPVAGSQVTIVAGGRYDGLIEELGGPPTPGSGFGLGLERLALNLQEQGLAPPPPPAPAILLVALTAEAGPTVTRLASDLRQAGVSATLSFGQRSLKAHLRHADRCGARLVVIVGERELQTGEAILRDLQSSAQRTLPLAQIVQEVRPPPVILESPNAPS